MNSDRLNLDEEIIDLHLMGLRLLQNRRFLGFSEDAAHLAEFAAGCVPEAKRVCELGSGNGGLLLALWARLKQADCTGLEIMPTNVSLSERSLVQNADVVGLTDSCRFVCGDWRRVEEYLPLSAFDLVVSNPPFWPSNRGRLSPIEEKRAATHELNGGLFEVVAAAHQLLFERGSFCLLLPNKRAIEAQTLLQEVGFVLRRSEEFAARILFWAQKN